MLIDENIPDNSHFDLTDGNYETVIRNISAFNLSLPFVFPKNESFATTTSLSLSLTPDEYSRMINWCLSIHTDRMTPTWLKVPAALAALLANSINVSVLSRPCMLSPINTLLGAMEAVNILLIATYLLPSLYTVVGPSYFTISFSARVLDMFNFFVSGTTTSASMWLTVFIGMFRCIAISWPLKAQSLCTMRRAKIVFFYVTLASLIFGLFSFMINSYREVKVQITNPVTNVSTTKYAYFYSYTRVSMQENSILPKLYLSLYVFNTIIPCIALSIFTICLVKNLWEVKTRRRNLCRQDSSEAPENKTTVMLLILLLSFLLTYCPSAAIVILMLVQGKDSDIVQTWVVIFSEGFFILVTNAATFFFYYSMSARFRETFLRMFPFCCSAKPSLANSVKSFTSYLARDNSSVIALQSTNETK